MRVFVHHYVNGVPWKPRWVVEAWAPGVDSVFHPRWTRWGAVRLASRLAREAA